MSTRKRINISVDPETYDKLQRLRETYGFKNTCELMVAFVHILLDRMAKGADRKYDLPDDDGAYIDEMFNELSDAERTPTNTPPPVHYYGKGKGYGKG